MLLLCKSLSQLRFGALMEVYRESLGENGMEFYPDLSAGEQILRAEQDFYAYLQTGFFTCPGDYYCIWTENSRYVSALRLQQFSDGMLLEALETHPDHRGKGYAEKLIRAVQAHFQPEKLYSHIGHWNTASQAVHQKCGFRKIAEHARYANGSVNSHCGTYLYETKNAG